MRKTSKKKIIMVFYKTVEDFEYEKYGGFIFEKYFDVEVWNLSQFYFGEDVNVKTLFSKQRKIRTIIEFCQNLNQNIRKKTFIFFLLPPGNRKTFYLESAASLMGFLYSMVYPQPCLAKWNTMSLKEFWRKNKPDYLHALLDAVFPPALNFVGTGVCFKEFPSVWSIKRQKNIMIHSLDYDIFLKIKNKDKRLIEDKYILFIDENLIEHNIYQMMSVDLPFKKPEDYYAPLRLFFDFVEKLFGYRVVIAEHPRSLYLDRRIYGKREMIKGQTARLIKDAELILCHKTLAVDYILLFKKKFLIIYLDEMMKFYQWESYYIPFFNYLKIQGLNISKPYNDEMIKERIVSSSSKECKKYKQNYIKAKGTEEKLFFEIAAKHILKVMDGREA